VATVSSGNVFADLGFENPTEERLKADLVMRITDEIERRGLSQSGAGRIMGLSQPDVSKMRVAQPKPFAHDPRPPQNAESEHPGPRNGDRP